VYSRTGEFNTEAIIDEGIYRRVYPLNFFKNSFYVLLQKKDDDGSIFLAKIPFQIDPPLKHLQGKKGERTE
jgi:hypothetical protein